jgi:hypothetical protein
MAGYENPSVQNFKDYFYRSFQFGTDPNVSILDLDITNAMQMTNVNMNQALFALQENYTIGYLLLTAHFLVQNIRSSSQGINGQFAFLEKTKGVGNVDVGFEIPKRILDNPYYSMLCKTNYGAQFLFMVLPRLNGVMAIAPSGITGPYGWRGPFAYNLPVFP